MAFYRWKSLVISLLIMGAFFLWDGVVSMAGEGIVVNDATGERLRLSKPPLTIVSLNPDFTGNIIALGVGERLVGITDYCRYQDDLTAPDRLGGLWQPNLERIVALQPELVLATREGNNPGIISTLRRLNIPVFVSGQSSSFQDYFELLRQLGYILGREVEAKRMISEFTDRINRIRLFSTDLDPVSVFLQVGVKPLVTINQETLIGEMIEIAGGDNIAADLSSRYPSISRERILSDNPEVIIIAAMGSEAAAGVAFWERFPELQAVRNQRIYVIDPDLICRLSPGLMAGLLKIESFIAEARKGKNKE
jgi:ABC-type Fe3+-hydroxamate transport system substrate-binding protein